MKIVTIDVSKTSNLWKWLFNPLNLITGLDSDGYIETFLTHTP